MYEQSIAQLLWVSESTVKTFVTRIDEKPEVWMTLDPLSPVIERGWVEGCARGKESRIGVEEAAAWRMP